MFNRAAMYVGILPILVVVKAIQLVVGLRTAFSIVCVCWLVGCLLQSIKARHALQLSLLRYKHLYELVIKQTSYVSFVVEVF